MKANAKQRYNDAWARFYEERGMVNPDSTSTGEKTTNCTNAAQNKGDKISYVTNCQPLTSRRIKNIFKRSGIFLLDRWYAIVGIVIFIVTTVVVPAMFEDADNYQEKAVMYAESIFNAERAGNMSELRRLREEMEDYASELTFEARMQFFVTYENTYDNARYDWALRERAKSSSW